MYSYIYLENTKKNHNKYYELYRISYYFYFCRWGRISSPKENGNYKLYAFDNQVDYESKLMEKLKKQYDIIHKKQYNTTYTLFFNKIKVLLTQYNNIFKVEGIDEKLKTLDVTVLDKFYEKHKKQIIEFNYGDIIHNFTLSHRLYGDNVKFLNDEWMNLNKIINSIAPPSISSPK